MVGYGIIIPVRDWPIVKVVQHGRILFSPKFSRLRIQIVSCLAYRQERRETRGMRPSKA
jgi:hypothetical protein